MENPPPQAPGSLQFPDPVPACSRHEIRHADAIFPGGSCPGGIRAGPINRIGGALQVSSDQRRQRLIPHWPGPLETRTSSSSRPRASISRSASRRSRSHPESSSTVTLATGINRTSRSRKCRRSSPKPTSTPPGAAEACRGGPASGPARRPAGSARPDGRRAAHPHLRAQSARAARLRARGRPAVARRQARNRARAAGAPGKRGGLRGFKNGFKVDSSNGLKVDTFLPHAAGFCQRMCSPCAG